MTNGTISLNSVLQYCDICKFAFLNNRTHVIYIVKYVFGILLLWRLIYCRIQNVSTPNTILMCEYSARMYKIFFLNYFENLIWYNKFVKWVSGVWVCVWLCDREMINTLNKRQMRLVHFTRIFCFQFLYATTAVFVVFAGHDQCFFLYFR